MYQYANITYLGAIIFLGFMVFGQIVSLFDYHGLIYTIEGISHTSSIIALWLLPVAFIVSILVTISNIMLVKKEGLTLKNFLGVILGLIFCITPFLPELLYNLLFNLDIHNENSIWLYIEEFAELSIYQTIAYLECVLIATIILAIKSKRHIPEFNKDYILILGCKIKKDGSLTNLLKSRVDRAIEFRNMQKEKTGKDLIFIPSGGKGSDESIPEGQAMKNYLLENGIDEDHIIVEDKSKNTLENIKFSYNIVKEKNKDAQIAFATTNYHVLRAGSLASSQKIKMEGIGSKTKTYFWVNAFIREFIASVYSERKKHIKIFILLLIATFLTVMLTYWGIIA